MGPTPSPILRLRWRRRIRSLAALILLAGLALAVWFGQPAPVATVPLVHVIDGDSLVVRQRGARLTVRLTGIDAVEYRQQCVNDARHRWPCGREARARLEKIAGPGPLYCEVATKDRYKRTLAACRTRRFPDGIDLGAEMVRQGWAITTGDAYLVEETQARANHHGIWRGTFVCPADWRAAHERPATALALPDA